MNLAVKFYSQVPNPNNFPGIWPAEVRELGDSTKLPDGDWSLMTKDEYERHVAQCEPIMAEWETTKVQIIPEAQSELIVELTPADDKPLVDETLENMRIRINELESVLRAKGIL